LTTCQYCEIKRSCSWQINKIALQVVNLPISAKLERETQSDLAFPARQSLRNCAKRGRLTLLDLNGRRVGVIEQVEELEKPLHSESLANNPGFRDAQVHIDERRSREGVAPRLEVAAIEVAVAILIEGLRSTDGVAESTLRAQQAAELNLPRQFHKTMD